MTDCLSVLLFTVETGRIGLKFGKPGLSGKHIGKSNMAAVFPCEVNLLPQSICLPFFIVSVTYNVISFLHHLTSLSNVHFHTFKISVTWFGVPSKYFSEIKICFKSGSIFCEKSLISLPFEVSYMCLSICLGELYVLVHISGWVICAGPYIWGKLYVLVYISVFCCVEEF